MKYVIFMFCFFFVLWGTVNTLIMANVMRDLKSITQIMALDIIVEKPKEQHTRR